ncbi:MULTISPECIES: hypothetical protein [unclassified Roseobacter]|uniref:hypothetical protein n=1 Tax=unclassified Roseobacter TaxID=196798 RepID=UPI0018A2E057|nr:MULTISPECIES: hypothetical protein [unclassified Roseobacter]MDW3184188.1 hypothetical protein [Roseobacter sp.]
MGIVEDVADELALESLKIINATGDDAFVQRIADTIGGSSQTMEEAYLTAVRVRRAEQRAREVLQTIKDEMAGKLEPPQDG